MLFLSIVSTALSLATRGQFEGDQVIRFENLNAEHSETLHNLVMDHSLRLDVWSHGGSSVMDIRVPAAALHVVKSKTSGIQQSVWIPNVQAIVDQEKIESIENPFDSTVDTIFNAYQNASTYVEFLTAQPGVAEINLGKTYNGLDIRGAKFGTGNKQVFINGGIHAREWISPAVVTYVANYLLSSDAKAVEMRSLFTFHFVPVLNVDGYAYTRDPQGDRMWRKNREPNADSDCVGTDINRNFDIAWSKPGASSDPCSDAYYGPSAGSTKETRAVVQYLSGLKNLVSYFDFHSYSQLWMYPYGYKNTLTADNNDQSKATDLAVEALKKVNNVAFKHGPIMATIYQASGTTADYMYDLLKVKYSAAVELRDTGRYGFVLPASQIVPSGEEIKAGLLAFFTYVSSN